MPNAEPNNQTAAGIGTTFTSMATASGDRCFGTFSDGRTAGGGHNLCPVGARGGKHTVVPGQAGAGLRHQRSESRNKVFRLQTQLLETQSAGVHELIAANDGEFKHHLDRYKYPQWHEGAIREEHRAQAKKFLRTLEQRLSEHACLDSDRLSIVDAAIAPFVRQFAAVDQAWFAASPFPALRKWLAQILEGDHFATVMGKQPTWATGDTPLLFP